MRKSTVRIEPRAFRTFLSVLFLFSVLALTVFGQSPDTRKLELVVAAGHACPVLSVTFSPDGKMLASGSCDFTIKLWNAETGQQLRTLQGHTGEVYSVAFSPDGKTIASGSGDNTIKLWNAETGRQLRTLEGHTGPVFSVAFSPDGIGLVSGSQDYTIRGWIVETGQSAGSAEVHTGPVSSVAFSPDGKTLASGSFDATIKLWNPDTGQMLRSLEEHTNQVSSVAFSPDGKTIASGSVDKSIKLWNPDTGQMLRSLEEDTGEVRSVAFSPDGKTLASGGKDNTIKLWRPDTGKVMSTLEGNAGGISSVAYSPDGKTLASGITLESAKLNASGKVGGLIKLWNPETLEQLRSFDVNAFVLYSVAYSPDGKTIASGLWDKTIKLWNAETGQQLRTLEGHTGPVYSVAFSPDGKTLVSGSFNPTAYEGFDATIKLWDAETGQQLRTLEGHTDEVFSVAFSPDGKTIASGSVDKTIKLWNAETGQILRSLEGQTGPVYSVAFSPDGKTLASASFNPLSFEEILDHTIKLWNADTGQMLRSLEGHTYPVTSVAYSPDGKTIASGSADATIKLWNADTGQMLRSLEGHTGPVFSVAFSPDGKTIASGSADATIKLWNADTGQMQRNLEGHSFLVASVAFSPDGRFLVSGSLDQTAKIWDINSYRTVATLTAIANDDWAVIGPDGRFDASEGALKLMNYSFGFEVIDLSQLKNEYYEPGLLRKSLGFSKEPLRVVVPLEDVRLYPEIIEQKFDEKTGLLTVRLRIRNGGIGETRVFVNDKLVVPDARDEALRGDPNVPAGEIVTLTADLKGASVLNGDENRITVITSNYLKEIKKGNIQSRGAEISYFGEEEESGDTLPSLYAIVGGVSDYEGSKIDLKFAAKDAEDFSNALGLGARRLFCARENPDCLDKVQITTLSTSGKEGTIQPTKENFRKAFEEIGMKAKPEDIVVIFLAGHGVSFGSGTDTYFYLTKDASSASNDDLNKNYQTVAISSTELSDWLTQTEWTKGEKGIKALKQLMILDTCASGTAASALTAKRDLSGDQVRAIEFLKDKTGTFVLMGSTADAPSYEANQFGQGLLTYSLLQAIKGASLDQDRIDVRKLFSYAETNVPKMAKNIGGVQKPIVSAPLGKTFIIGQMTETDKLKINISSPKPLILRPRLGMLPRNNDPLNLTSELRKGLDAESSYEVVRRRGETEPILIYVDDDNFPGAVQITGTYSVEGDSVKINAYLISGDKEVELAEIIAGKDKVIEELMTVIRTELVKLK